jgi:hypothetical protein
VPNCHPSNRSSKTLAPLTNPWKTKRPYRDDDGGDDGRSGCRHLPGWPPNHSTSCQKPFLRPKNCPIAKPSSDFENPCSPGRCSRTAAWPVSAGCLVWLKPPVGSRSPPPEPTRLPKIAGRWQWFQSPVPIGPLRSGSWTGTVGRGTAMMKKCRICCSFFGRLVDVLGIDTTCCFVSIIGWTGPDFRQKADPKRSRRGRFAKRRLASDRLADVIHKYDNSLLFTLCYSFLSQIISLLVKSALIHQKRAFNFKISIDSPAPFRYSFFQSLKGSAGHALLFAINRLAPGLNIGK